MKVCPECGTQYEDHVPTCIADGVELVSAPKAAAAHPVAAPTPTPTPTPPPTPTPRPAPTYTAPPPPALAPAGPRWSLLVVAALLLLGGGGVVAVAVGGLVLSSQLGGRSTTGVSSGGPTPAPPDPRAETPAPVDPVEQPTVAVQLTSEPPGAAVYENDQYVCDTPCAVPHPAHAPLPRFFVFQLPGHREKTFEMNDANQPISVQMVRSRSAAVAPDAPAPGSPPRGGPGGPRPSIGRER